MTAPQIHGRLQAAPGVVGLPGDRETLQAAKSLEAQGFLRIVARTSEGPVGRPGPLSVDVLRVRP